MITARRLLALSRPALLPAVLALVVVGYGFAHWNLALPARGVGSLLSLMGAWTLLHVGTLWLNAVLDRDEGEVLLGAAVPVPSATGPLGHLLLALSVVWASSIDPMAGIACAGAALLAEAYSHPWLAWKAHPLLGPGVNAVGYGILTPLAGWAVVDVPVDLRTVAMAPAVAVAVVGCAFAAQVFQGPEDRARGYHTLVATAGPTATVRAARTAWGAAFVWVILLAAAGWLPTSLVLLVLPWAWLDRDLRRWEQDGGAGGVERVVGVGRRLAWSALAGLVLLSVPYVVDSLAGRPVAGLATRAGHPCVPKGSAVLARSLRETPPGASMWPVSHDCSRSQRSP